MQDNYASLLDRISTASGIAREEVEKRVEARRAKLSGLISKEGAAQIIAAELKVSFDNVDLKISELMPGMKKVNVVGKIVNVFPIRSFEKGGKKGKVANFIVADETGNVKIVLWDTNHISLLESGELKQGDVAEIKNGSVREGEIHLSGFSTFAKSSKKMDVVKTERLFSEKSLDSVQEGTGVQLRGNVVQLFPPRFFSVCPECGKKVISEADGFSCNEHGKVMPKEKPILNFVLDDGTDSIRVVLFSEQVEKVTSSEKLKDPAGFVLFKEEFLGSEIFVKGVVKKNSLFNTLELTAQDVNKTDPDKLIEFLEKG